MNEKERKIPLVEISDEDIYEAMKEIPGYLDITTGDFKEVYQLAYRYAVRRLTTSVKERDVMTKDPHERAYKEDDIHLLKEHEAKSLGTLESVQEWFGAIYQEYLVAKIQRALKRLVAR